jgi:hypothetical protein
VAGLSRGEICTDKPYPYFGAFPSSADLVHYAIKAFEIPSLPVLTADYQQIRSDLVKSILYRFQLYVTELHRSGAGRAIALQLMCHPEASTFNSRVRAYILCRATAKTMDGAVREVNGFADQAFGRFPSEGMFSYGAPAWLSEADTQRVLFKNVTADQAAVDVVELRKYEDFQTTFPRPQLHYVAHRFWSDQQRDPWPALIETLSGLTRPTAIRIELTPVVLRGSGDDDFVSLAGRWFGLVAEDLERKASQGEVVRTDGVITEEMLRSGDLQIASDNAANVSYVKRGRHVFSQLLSFGDHLFSVRVLLAAEERVTESVIGGVRAALSAPTAGGEGAAVGWVRPDVIRPAEDEKREALACLQFMAQTSWGDSSAAIAPEFRKFRTLVTPEEAVGLFHLPIYDRFGQTSALSTAEFPFVIPPEALSRTRYRKEDRKISLGHLYQREKLLTPDAADEQGQPFHVTIGDLMKPSLLVGAPGSGKTNLAMSMLVQLWKVHGIPFLVLDPSTGQEFRMLLSDPSLRGDLVYYTVGDTEVAPLQFNPFSVPPGVTVRNHMTRILAAFKAAFTFVDPVPTIYEGALERLYTDARYSADGRTMRLDEKGKLDSPAPTLSSFSAAIQDEVREKAAALYEGAKESIGIIRGASTIRVNAIGRKLDYIMNVPANNGTFMQNLLRRPAIIEMGALGDSSNIALVMAFLLAQIAGHIEYAYRTNRDRQHVIFIEEAHRLLAAGDGEGVGGKSAEDINVMLAEMRKFGQGILVMDQRPSSLVGGVLDNAYVKILTRLSDRVGFDRLSDELNLNESQQRFARTRLKPGDAIVLDMQSGQPVLLHSEDVKKEMEARRLSESEERELNRANTKKFDVFPPKATRFLEPKLDAAGAAAGNTAEAKEWFGAYITSELNAFLGKMRMDAHLYHGIKKKIAEAGKGAADAKIIVDSLIEKHRGDFGVVVDGAWEKLKWAMIGKVASESSNPGVEKQSRDLGMAATPSARAAAKTIAPSRADRFSKRLEPVNAQLSREIVEMLIRGRNDAKLWYDVKGSLLPEAKAARSPTDIASEKMTGERGRFDRLTQEHWAKLMQILVDEIAAEPVSAETAKVIHEKLAAHLNDRQGLK